MTIYSINQPHHVMQVSKLLQRCDLGSCVAPYFVHKLFLSAILFWTNWATALMSNISSEVINHTNFCDSSYRRNFSFLQVISVNILSLRSEYAEHEIRKCDSLSHVFMSQQLHNRSSGGMYLFLLLYLPVSMFNLWALSLSLASSARSIGSWRLKYCSFWNLCFIIL